MCLVNIWSKTQSEVEIMSGYSPLGACLDVRVDHNKSTGTKRGAGIGPWRKKSSVVWAEFACLKTLGGTSGSRRLPHGES